MFDDDDQMVDATEGQEADVAEKLDEAEAGAGADVDEDEE